MPFGLKMSKAEMWLSHQNAHTSPFTTNRPKNLQGRIQNPKHVFSKTWNTCQVITLGRACCMHVFDFPYFYFDCQMLPKHPVIASTSLAEDKVVRAKQLAERSSTNTVHGSWNRKVVDGWQVVPNATLKPWQLLWKKKFNGMINAPTVCMDPTAWFQIHQHCTWHITSTSCFVEVYINTFLSQSENFFGRH